jgi:hypothetical protein
VLLIIATLVNQNYKVVNAHKKTIYKRGTIHKKKRVPRGHSLEYRLRNNLISQQHLERCIERRS